MENYADNAVIAAVDVFIDDSEELDEAFVGADVTP